MLIICPGRFIYFNNHPFINRSICLWVLMPESQFFVKSKNKQNTGQFSFSPERSFCVPSWHRRPDSYLVALRSVIALTEESTKRNCAERSPHPQHRRRFATNVLWIRVLFDCQKSQVSTPICYASFCEQSTAIGQPVSSTSCQLS